PIPDEARRQLVQALGPTFLVFRDKVQKELKLSAEQRSKVQDRLAVTMRDAQQFFRTHDALAPARREHELAAYGRRAQELLAAFLQGALNREQLERLGQLELQQQGAFVLMRPDLADELKITMDQRRQFIGVMQELEGKVRSLIQAGGDADL